MPKTQLKALCFYLLALLPLFIGSSVQAGPVGLAHREAVGSDGYINKRGMNQFRRYFTAADLHKKQVSLSVVTRRKV